MVPVSLYLHIPFCQHRCSYCDFNTYTTLSDQQATYVDSLIAEIRQVAQLAEEAGQRLPLQTVFFGGGTPSLLDAKALCRLLEAIHTSFGCDLDAEVTLEANPDTVTVDYLTSLRQLGINRLSFGVQSANANELALLERTHDFGRVVDAVRDARGAGFESINLDLIYGLPNQTVADFETSLEAVLALEPEHLSLYGLTIEPGTPMKRWLESGRISLPDADLAAEQYDYASERLETAGFQHYEISNWAQPGKHCRHNLAYWRNDSYLGLGAGAHGHVAGLRYHVVKRPRDYIRRMAEGQPGSFPLSAAVAGSHQLAQTEAMSDTVIMQLRLLDEGLSLAAFESQFELTFSSVYGEQLAQMTEWGMLERNNDHIRLTKRGRLVSNQLFYRFL